MRTVRLLSPPTTEISFIPAVEAWLNPNRIGCMSSRVADAVFAKECAACTLAPPGACPFDLLEPTPIVLKSVSGVPSGLIPHDMNYVSVSAPASKVADLIGRLAEVSHLDQVDEVALARIESQARQFMDADPAGAHTVMGCVAAIRGDSDDARRHHEIAMQHDSDVRVAYNYSVSLSLLHENVRALRVVSEALQKAPDIRELLDQAIVLALANGRFTQAARWCAKWESLFPDAPHEHAALVRYLAGKVVAGEVDEESAGEILNLADFIQRDRKIRSARWRIWPDPEDSSSHVFERHVLTTPLEAALMNEELAGQIAEKPDLMRNPGIKFVPMFIGTRC